MTAGFGGYRADPEETPQEQEPQELQESGVIDNEFAIQLLEVLERGFSDVAARQGEVKNSLIGLIELDPMTGRYVGKMGVMMEAIRDLIASRNDDYMKAAQAIAVLKPSELYAQMREALIADQAGGRSDIQYSIDLILKYITNQVAEIETKRKADAISTANGVNAILGKQEDVLKRIGYLDNKVIDEIAKSSLERQDTKSAIQAGVTDYGRIVNDALSGAVMLQKICYFFIILFGVVALGGIWNFQNQSTKIEQLQVKNYEYSKLIEDQKAKIATMKVKKSNKK